MSAGVACRGLVIAAPNSGAGKTTVTLAIMRALSRTGLKVQPFKCGPDYIDPAFHTAATGRESTNLDSWAMDTPAILSLARGLTEGCDIAIVEGVMGLFDGVAAKGLSGRGTTAEMAALLGWPVVLVLDCGGQAETAAAVALGCKRYRDDVQFAGVILNNVAGERHLNLMEPAFARLEIPVLGVLMRNAALAVPERHLGLLQATEIESLEQRLDALADAADRSFDLARICSAARASAFPGPDAARPAGPMRPPGMRIALARDEAFTFVYPHVVRHWRSAGASILPFSPLADEEPDAACDAIWLPGGYPELHAARLAAAGKFKAALLNAAARGLSVHGECGGYMALGKVLVDAAGVPHPMADLLDVETSFAARKLHLGYRRARLLADGPLGTAGSEVLGHEFHYASLVRSGEDALAACSDASGKPVAEQGSRRGTVTGTFFHVIGGGRA